MPLQRAFNGIAIVSSYLIHWFAVFVSSAHSSAKREQSVCCDVLAPDFANLEARQSDFSHQ